MWKGKFHNFVRTDWHFMRFTLGGNQDHSQARLDFVGTPFDFALFENERKTSAHDICCSIDLMLQNPSKPIKFTMQNTKNWKFHLHCPNQKMYYSNVFSMKIVLISNEIGLFTSWNYYTSSIQGIVRPSSFTKNAILLYFVHFSDDDSTNLLLSFIRHNAPSPYE